MTAFALVLGSLFGSFVNVLVHRLPRGQDVVFRRSACPACGSAVRWRDNVPLLGYLLLRGRCRRCRGRISPRYPAVELAAAVPTALLFPAAPSAASLLEFAFQASVLYAFIAVVLIDLEFRIIPDGLNLFLALACLASGLLRLPPAQVLLGALVGGGPTFLVAWAFRRRTGEVGLGGGDIKLFAALGLHLGPLEVTRTIFASCLLGSLAGLAGVAAGKMARRTPIPFGPFIVLVASVQMLAPGAWARLLALISGALGL